MHRGVVAVALLVPRTVKAQCVDEALKQQLVGERAYRGVVPRLFQKALRHEVSAMGGWFAGDLSDGAPLYWIDDVLPADPLWKDVQFAAATGLTSGSVTALWTGVGVV